MFNLGMRYEYYTPPRELGGTTPLFDSITLSMMDLGGALSLNDKTTFAPRAALSWSPSALRGNTVIRVGGGIYYGPGRFGDLLTPIENNALSLMWPGGSYPADFPMLLGMGVVPSLLNAYDVNNYRIPERSIEYGISVQQQLPVRLVGQIGYTGSLGRHLFRNGTANPILAVDPATGDVLRQNPYMTEVLTADTGGRSRYDSLQLGLTRRFVDELTLGMAYTWSHSIGDE
ncbi:MAG: hypothetical protein M1541_01660 [Acidobacteria bacterium]|nr:hypothetical protein [Acidobacteriota bacterium]